MSVAVFHPGTQHSWQTATALQQLGQLEWFATSIFYQPDKWPYRFARFLPPAFRTRAELEFRRFEHPALNSDLVRTSGASEWFERAASRLNLNRLARIIDNFGNRRFASFIARDLKNTDPFALWGFNGCCLDAFTAAKQMGRRCILDRTIGDYRFYNEVMATVFENSSDWFPSPNWSIPESQIELDESEYYRADNILVGCDFAADTIARYSSVDSIGSKISVLNYCYDDRLFNNLIDPVSVRDGEKVKFLFLGQVSMRKGVHNLLKAWSKIDKSKAELTIVGKLSISEKKFAEHVENITYFHAVPRNEVPKIMSDHHVFILPSYFEGSSISLLEALASGLAIIQTPMAGVGVDQHTGLMIESPDDELLQAAMEQVLSNLDRLNTWRYNSKKRAQDFSFARYRENVARLPFMADGEQT
jgi:glycosyltransferase involved in cell wall biosynthesis